MSSFGIQCASNITTPSGAGEGFSGLAFDGSAGCAKDPVNAQSMSPASMSDTNKDPAPDTGAHTPESTADAAAKASVGGTPVTSHDPKPEPADELQCSTPNDQLPTTSSDAPTAELESSLLLKPFAGFPENVATDTAVSMATPQSLQDGSTTLSPLEMLIAALDPQKQSQSGQSIMKSSANTLANGQQQTDGSDKATDGSFGALPEGFWNTSLGTPGVDGSGFSGLSWDAARRASDAALLNSYQIGQPPSDSTTAVPQPQMAGLAARKGSYPPGVKRPYSDFDQLLTAADMYAGGNLSNALSQAAAGPPMPAKHARHGSMVECSTSIDTAAAAAAAAAVAAGNTMPYNAAFPSSTRRSTTMSLGQQDMGAQTQALNPCFDQLSQGAGSGLSLDTGYPLMSGAPLSQMQIAQSLSMATHPQQMQYAPQHTRSLSLSHVDHVSGMMVPPMPASLHMTSPMSTAAAVAASAANHHPAIGYFYDGLGGGAPGHGVEEFIPTPMPIPSIPGVTVSPKMKPRRMSVPDLTPTAEEKQIGSKALPRRQKVRFGDDLYTPTWVRGSGQQKEGFCDTCSPGKWLQLKNSAFWYHKQFFHGISSVSGRPFIRPVQVRHYDADIIEGMCHQCQQWVPIANAKRRNSVLWFRHAHKCHVYHKPKNECELGEYPIVDSGASMLDIQSPADHVQLSSAE
ncbi:hypothetical protein IWW50_005456 [Coemansia erecta]|nr:hypothetical protein IWW50_005456 [Coemansia erecta]